jgi:hypothetical protein
MDEIDKKILTMFTNFRYLPNSPSAVLGEVAAGKEDKRAHKSPSIKEDF